MLMVEPCWEFAIIVIQQSKINNQNSPTQNGPCSDGCPGHPSEGETERPGTTFSPPNSPISAASKYSALALKSPAPPNLASEAGSPPVPPRPSTQTARTASIQTQTTTHILRPRAQAHASLHTVRGTQERRPLQSRF